MNQPTLKEVTRFCADIGIWALDRPIIGTCHHRTPFCDSRCYNVKLYRIYPAMHEKDERNEAAWRSMTPIDVDALAAKLRRSKKGRKTESGEAAQLRLMTRGESFADLRDIDRVDMLCQGLPDTIIWAPSRAWRDPVIWAAVLGLMARRPNLRVCASLDPSNTEEEMHDLETAGVTTMFFGDDDATATMSGGKRFRCPKTHGKIKGACAVCKRGCMREKAQHVHLSTH